MRSLTEIINLACRGSLSAKDFLSGVYHAIDLWDDLIDRDEIIVPEKVHATFEFLLLYLPANPWFLANRATLLPIMQSFILSWHTANAQKPTNPEQSYILRQMYFDLITTVAVLTGGSAFAKTVSLELWKMSAETISLAAYLEKK